MKLVFLFLIIIPSLVFAKDAQLLSNKNFRVVNYGLEQGLSQSSIYALEQDDDGYLWIATQSGLNRFNGIEFTVFNHDKNNKNSLPYPSLKSLYFDHDHKLWIGSDSGLSYFDTHSEKFVVPNFIFDGQNNGLVTKIYSIDKEHLWVVNKGFLWSVNTKTFKTHLITLGKYGSELSRLAIDTKGKIWFYVDDKIIETHFNNDGTVSTSNLKVIINNLPYCNDLKLEGGTLWLLCENNLFKLPPESHKFIQVKPLAHSKNINFIDIVQYQKHIWLATDHGLLHQYSNENTWSHFDSNPVDKFSLPSNLIYRLFVDNHGLLWIGSFSSGVSMWDPNFQYIDTLLSTTQLSKFTSRKEQWRADVTGVSISKDGHIWASTRGAGVLEMNQKGDIVQQISMSTVPVLPTNLILDILVDNQNRLWLSTESYGIFFRDEQGKWFNFVDQQFNSQQKYILDVYQDSRGRILVGTLEGLFLFQESDHSFHSLIDQLPEAFKKISLRFSKIFEGSDGNFWFATDGGLILMDKDLKFKHWFFSTGKGQKILHKEVNDISEDKFGNIWIATAAGVNKLFYLNDKWNIFSYDNVQQLRGNSYYAILNDDSGFVWVAGTQGIIKLNPTSEEVFKIPLEYGLQSLEFNPNAVNKDPQGNLYFGGIRGLNVIHPQQLNLRFFNPSIVLSKFLADGKNVKFSREKQSYTIPDTTKYIRMEFDTVDLANAKNIELRMRIPEISQTWSPWSTQHHINLFDMSEGVYRLQTQTKILSHQNLLTEKTYTINVISTVGIWNYFQWFLLVLLAGLIAYSVNRRYKKWQQQKLTLINDQLKLEETLKFTESELIEKNDEYHLLLDELSKIYRDKELLELQIQELHLVDKQTGLHSRDFIKYSIDNTIRQITNLIEKEDSKADGNETQIPHLLFIIIKLDGYESLRIQGGQFLLNQIIIQIASEMQKIGGPADELVRWNNDSFLFYAKVEPGQKIQELCQRICYLFRKGQFGPSDYEQLSITCSLAAVEYPFCDDNPSILSWSALLGMAEKAAKWYSEVFEDGWLIIGSTNTTDNKQIVELAQKDFEKALKSGNLEIKSSRKISSYLETFNNEKNN